MMETRGSAMMDMQPMVQPLAGRWDGRRARAARGAVLALLSALGSVLLGASPALASPVSFSGPTNFAAGPGPPSVAVGDFNGDSDPGLAVANFNSNNVSVLLNNHTPVAVGDSYTTEEDTPLNVGAEAGVLSNDTDSDADALSADVVSG